MNIYTILIKAFWGLFLLSIFQACIWPDPPAKQAENQGETEYKIPPELESKVRRINNLVERKIKNRQFNGVVLVSDYGNIIYKRAHGYAERGKKTDIDEFSTFQLASVSKMFTATAVMLLHHQGKLSYDDSLTQYLPSFPYAGVTIRNLLNHRSGIPRYMVISDEYWPRDTMMNNWDMHDLMVEHCPEAYYKPDYRFNYQNSNYAYLALLVEKISGKKFAHFCRDEIFEPLEMYDTKVFAGKDSTDIPNAVMGHVRSRRKALDPYENYINGVVGDKGVYSSVHDLLKFDQALYDGRFLPDSVLLEAYKPGSPERKKNNYGFGWRMKPFEHDVLIYHGGWWNGFRTAFKRYLISRRAIIVLTNKDQRLSLPNEIEKILFDDQPLDRRDTL